MVDWIKEMDRSISKLELEKKIRNSNCDLNILTKFSEENNDN